MESTRRWKCYYLNLSPLYSIWISFEEELFIPNNTFNYCTSIIYSKDWNHWVFSEILKKLSKVNIVKLNQNKILPNIEQKKEKAEILTTEKDYVKIPKEFSTKIKYLDISLKIQDEERLINFLKDNLYE